MRERETVTVSGPALPVHLYSPQSLITGSDSVYIQVFLTRFCFCAPGD